MLKKYAKDLTVVAVERLHERYVLLRLTDAERLPAMVPGQFVEVRIDDEPSVFLRRPISINFVDRQRNELWLLVALVGNGTRRLSRLVAGDRLNVVLPLGNGFSLPAEGSVDAGRRLLVGGGVGVAPLLCLGAVLRERGVEPTFLLGARTREDLLMLPEFEKYGRVCLTTEDGSMGERGFVTNHSILQRERFDLIQTCGPTPMMKAVARFAREHDVDCEASLENMMACGLGACLCCVEKVRTSPVPCEGHTAPDSPVAGKQATANVCVCKEGPVFNVKRLLWE